MILPFKDVIREIITGIVMTPLSTRLSQLESHLQNLVEGGARRIFADPKTPGDLASKLTGAMSDGIHPGAEGELVAPNLFTIQAHPDLAGPLEANQILLEGLKESIRELGREANLVFAGPIVIRVAPDESLSSRKLRVQAQDSREDLPSTVSHEVKLEEALEAIPERTFLIVDGTQIHPLTRAVVNIGRREDNHLVIEDKRVSRLHAQLRASKGRYSIFDLDSTGGTFVNGERVHQKALKPGDVISLAGLPLVFGQEDLAPGETQDYVPSP